MGNYNPLKLPKNLIDIFNQRKKSKLNKYVKEPKNKQYFSILLKKDELFSLNEMQIRQILNESEGIL
jgi:disulfide oxidoreductase YuzD